MRWHSVMRSRWASYQLHAPIRRVQNLSMTLSMQVKEVREAPPDEAEQEGLSQFDRLEQQLSV